MVSIFFLLGIFAGLFSMFYICDHLLGHHLTWSKREASTSNYQVRVEGGIISRVNPLGLNIRATGLNLKLELKGKGRSSDRLVLIEISNLPHEIKVSHHGPGMVAKGGDSLIAVVSLKHRPVEFTLSAAPEDEREPFTFYVGGDSRGRLDLMLKLLQRAYQQRPMFVVLGGDLVAHGLWWQYQDLLELLEEFPIPVFSVPGNHDLEFCGRRSFTRYLAQDHYAFSYGECLFVILDNNWKDGGQLKWLDKTLGRSGFAHRFVFVHKPPFDPRPNNHHCMGDQRFAKGLLETLVKHKVDILFCSHIHSFIQTSYKGMRIVITGGLGAHRKEPLNPFHYLQVRVSKKGIQIQMVPFK